jgi:hypothetical protein
MRNPVTKVPKNAGMMENRTIPARTLTRRSSDARVARTSTPMAASAQAL